MRFSRMLLLQIVSSGRHRMEEISRRRSEMCFRAVDIERGLFQLIQRGDIEIAAQMRAPDAVLVADSFR